MEPLFVVAKIVGQTMIPTFSFKIVLSAIMTITVLLRLETYE